MVAFSFGSFGDVIAVVQVLDDIRTTLASDKGSYSEFRSLVGELDQFTQSLVLLDRLQVQFGHSASGCGAALMCPSTQPQGVPADALMDQLHMLQGAMSASAVLAADLQGTLARYEVRNLKAKRRWQMWFMSMWCMLRWALSPPRREIDSFRLRLLFQSGNVNQILLAMLFAA